MQGLLNASNVGMYIDDDDDYPVGVRYGATNTNLIPPTESAVGSSRGIFYLLYILAL